MKRGKNAQPEPEEDLSFRVGLAVVGAALGVLPLFFLLRPLVGADGAGSSPLTIMRGNAGPSQWPTLAGLVLLPFVVWFVYATFKQRYRVGTPRKWLVAGVVTVVVALGLTLVVHRSISERLKNDAYRIDGPSTHGVDSDGDGAWSREMRTRPGYVAVDWDNHLLFRKTTDDERTVLQTIDLDDGSLVRAMSFGPDFGPPNVAVDEDGWLVWNPHLTIAPDGKLMSESTDKLPFDQIPAESIFLDDDWTAIETTSTAVVAQRGDYIAGYDVPTGEELWRVEAAWRDEIGAVSHPTADGGTVLATWPISGGSIQLRRFAADGTLDLDVEVPGDTGPRERLQYFPDGRSAVWNQVGGDGPQINQLSVIDVDGDVITTQLPASLGTGPLLPHGDGFVGLLNGTWTTFNPSADGTHFDVEQGEEFSSARVRVDIANDVILNMEERGTVRAITSDGQVQDTFEFDYSRFGYLIDLGLIDGRLVIIAEMRTGVISPS